MSSIFLSHSHKDKPFARKLSAKLREHGINTWLDEAEMQVGDSLITKIGEGIRECRYLGVVISRHSVTSEWVRREVNIALTDEIQGKRIKVLPLLCERCELPAFLADKIYADFTRDFNEGLDTLLARFRADLNTNQNQPRASTGTIALTSRKAGRLLWAGIILSVLAAIIGIAYVNIPSTIRPQQRLAETEPPNAHAHLRTRQDETSDDLTSPPSQGSSAQPQVLANQNRDDNSSAGNSASSKRGKQKLANLDGTPAFVTSQLAQARNLFRQGDYPGAIRVCDKVLNIDPNNSLAKKIKAEAMNAENY